MTTDSRYQILFEPLDIGPVTTRNRFYQVPHCTGMGRLHPHMVADVRATKAALLLARNGFAKVHVVRRGMSGWSECGYAVES